MAPSVPLDLYDQICAWIHDGGENPLYLEDEAQLTLTHLSQVSRAWAFASAKIRYEQLIVRTIPQLAKLLELLSTPNNIKTHVREVVLGSSCKAYGTMNMYQWASKYVDLRLFESLLPSLTKLQVGTLPNIHRPPWQPLPTFPCFNSNFGAVPEESRLSSLRIQADAFTSPTELTRFLANKPSLSELCLSNITRTSVIALYNTLPRTIRSLRLVESTLSCRADDRRLDSPHSPRGLILSLDKFYYRNLSGQNAYILEPILVELSRNALVDIRLSIAHNYQPDFDANAFRDRITEACHQGGVSGINDYLKGPATVRQAMNTLGVRTGEPHAHWALSSAIGDLDTIYVVDTEQNVDDIP